MRESRDIDKLFKDKLLQPDTPFNDLDWEKLENRLHPRRKNNLIPAIWISALVGIAATLIVIFFVGDYSSQQVRTQKNARRTPAKQTISNKPENPYSSSEKLIEENIPKSVNVDRNVELTKPERKIGYASNETNVSFQYSDSALYLKQLSPLSLTTNISSTPYSHIGLQAEHATIPDGVMEKDVPSTVVKSKPRLVMSILAAPDLTTVQKSGKNSLSGGFGLTATVVLNQKLSISTGVLYAKKVYDSDFSLYRPNTNYVFKNKPSNIHANCDVIDIPLNLNFKVWQRKQNAIMLSGGLSSYLMLEEDYNYTYDNNATGPQYYDVKNRNQHYLGVANVGLEFQHKINNDFSISATPFMKIPLTGIGYGNAKLSSTGVAISLNMNLFKK
ncbi:hypothetical protein [Pedobacter sandarakinus]|uniref:hypothetical protein n=1 Tax=Pedobacter sandarakinus TaxID=353156 RepID=UPI002246E68A|nr:hypothetical protein [Pedobacter sandarakinus]MCX2573390.1 hypothetical protein [Pedobacter sandarakinus]